MSSSTSVATLQSATLFGRARVKRSSAANQSDSSKARCSAESRHAIDRSPRASRALLWLAARSRADRYAMACWESASDASVAASGPAGEPAVATRRVRWLSKIGLVEMSCQRCRNAVVGSGSARSGQPRGTIKVRNTDPSTELGAGSQDNETLPYERRQSHCDPPTHADQVAVASLAK